MTTYISLFCPPRGNFFKMENRERFAITFGEVALLHVGGKEFGTGRRENGYSVQELRELGKRVECKTELVMISDALPENLRESNEAAVLVLRGGANFLLEYGADNRLLQEQKTLVAYDEKYWDNRRKTTLNKRARKNTVFGEKDIEHSENYKQCTVNSFEKLEHLNKLRKGLCALGDKAENLNAEGNWYFESKSGIGFHGDAERKIVICLSLGNSSTLRYCWRLAKETANYGSPVDVVLNHGDIYIMSEKATGYDWLFRSKVRVVHAAGHEKYLKTERKAKPTGDKRKPKTPLKVVG